MFRESGRRTTNGDKKREEICFDWHDYQLVSSLTYTNNHELSINLYIHLLIRRSLKTLFFSSQMSATMKINEHPGTQLCSVYKVNAGISVSYKSRFAKIGSYHATTPDTISYIWYHVSS